MNPPIIINESARIDASGDLGVYDSMELAERSLEQNDSGDDQLHVFDSEGLRLEIVGDPDFSGCAHLEAVQASPQHRDTLLTILRDFLVKRGEPNETVEAMTLEHLVRAAGDRSPNPYSDERNKRRPHYHRRSCGPDGDLLPGQGLRRHRPWDTSPYDKGFWDRF